MEDEEDDFYDPTDSVTAAQTQNDAQNAAQTQPQEGADMDEEEVEVEDDEVGRSSYFSTPFANNHQDDFNIITEAPADAPLPEV